MDSKKNQIITKNLVVVQDTSPILVTATNILRVTLLV